MRKHVELSEQIRPQDICMLLGCEAISNDDDDDDDDDNTNNSSNSVRHTHLQFFTHTPPMYTLSNPTTPQTDHKAAPMLKVNLQNWVGMAMKIPGSVQIS